MNRPFRKIIPSYEGTFVVLLIGERTTTQPLSFKKTFNRPVPLYLSLTFGRQCGYDTRSAPNKQGRTCMAPSLDGARAGPLANTLFGAKHGGHCHRQCASTLPSFVVRCCVTAELVDFDRDSRTDGLVYTAALFIHFRRSFLEFLRISETLL